MTSMIEEAELIEKLNTEIMNMIVALNAAMDMRDRIMARMKEKRDRLMP